MKCGILAAGKGTRMLPLTENIPKPLVEVNGRPFLSYLIENLKKAGFDEIGLVVGYKKEKIEEWNEAEKLGLTLIEQKEQKGTAHAVELFKEWVGEEEFVVVNGDNLYGSEDLKKLNSNDAFNYVLAIKGDPRQFGELITDGDYLTRIREKPKNIITGLINAGAYKFTPEVFEEISKLEPSERGEYEITDALTNLSEKKKVKVIESEEYWINFGSVEDVKLTEEFVSGEFQ